MGLQDRIHEAKVRLLEGALDASAAHNPRMRGNRRAGAKPGPSSAVATAGPYSVGETPGEGPSGAGSIELSDVLLGRPGRVIYRFRCEHPGEVPRDLAVRKLSGGCIDAEIRRLSTVRVEGGRCSYVMSAEMSSDVTRFIADMPGIPPLPVKPAEIKRISFERDMLMVNPGIDGLYEEWFDRHRAGAKGPGTFTGEGVSTCPRMSVVTPLFNTSPEHLTGLVGCMLAQTYPDWEHVLVNASPENAELSRMLESLSDPRFKVVTLGENLGIAENTVAGIKVSTGDYVSFLDHDDIIEPNALEEYVRAIAAHPGAALLYCDEDSMSEDGKRLFDPILKPRFNLDMALSWNYVLHMLTLSREAIESIVLPGPDVDGYQDYDMTLKSYALPGGAVHVPKVLYHWRQHDGSKTHSRTAQHVDFESDDSAAAAPGIRVLDSYFKRRGIDAKAHVHDLTWLFEVDYARASSRDVSVVVWGSSPGNADALLGSLASQDTSNVRELLVDEEFDGVRGAAHLAAQAEGDFLLFVSVDAELDQGFDTIARLRAMMRREDVGIAAAKALAKDGLNQSCGICVKSDGSFGFLNQGFAHGMGGGYLGCAEETCDYSAVDGTCLMVRRADFEATGGFDVGYQSKLAAFVDLSFAVRGLGKRVAVTPFAKVSALAPASHFELGASFVSPGTPDHERLWRKWGSSYREDVLHNPNVKLDRSYFNLDL